MEVRREHLADEALRGERAKERAAERAVVERAGRLEELGERRARAVDLDGGDEPLREVNAVRAPAILDELEGAARARAVERAEEIAERRRAESAGELHASPLNQRRRVGQLFGRRGAFADHQLRRSRRGATECMHSART